MAKSFAKKIIKALLCFFTMFLLVVSPEGPRLNKLLAEEYQERINMEEMNIRGDLYKPHIMYIIPRAKLSADLSLHDDFFFKPSSVAGAGWHEEKYSMSIFADGQVIPPSWQKAFSRMNTREIRQGSCISCHYAETALPDFPQDQYHQSFISDLNQLCLRCHSVHYYNICWAEVEKNTTSQETRSFDMLCPKCHPGWLKKVSEGKKSSWDQTRPREYNTDNFCKICHRSKVY